MKNPLLLMLLIVFVFAGCKKENKLKKSPVPLNEYIQRTWSTTLEKKEYFDATNSKVFEQNLAPGVYYIMHQGTLKVRNLQGKNVSGSYTLSSSNGKTMIAISLNGATETYELVSITDKHMTIRQEKNNQTYNDNTEKVAAKLIYTIEFTCACQ